MMQICYLNEQRSESIRKKLHIGHFHNEEQSTTGNEKIVFLSGRN